ncbi:MAG: OmpA family protein [Acetobacteraceae bacterium]
MRHAAFMALSAALAFGSLPAFGQGSPAGTAQGNNPSTEQIIKSLTPSGNLDTTRGIRLAHPAAPQTPQGTASAATQSASAPAAPAVNLTVLFATNSAELTPEATRTMEQLGHALTSQQLTPFRFRVVGHTDTVGTAAYNLELSRRRADAVVAYLEQKYNIPASRLEAAGVGESGLLVPTGPQTPEARNRRVQVINLGT